MSEPYAAGLPVDKSGAAMQEYPAAMPAKGLNFSENNTVSSLITLTDNTTVIEVAATGGPAAIRWVPATETAGVAPAGSVITAAATANFDHVIETATVRRFVVPRNTAGVQSIVGANIRNGLYNRVAVKTFGISSVATIQF